MFKGFLVSAYTCLCAAKNHKNVFATFAKRDQPCLPLDLWRLMIWTCLLVAHFWVQVPLSQIEENTFFNFLDGCDQLQQDADPSSWLESSPDQFTFGPSWLGTSQIIHLWAVHYSSCFLCQLPGPNTHCPCTPSRDLRAYSPCTWRFHAYQRRLDMSSALA